MTLSFSVWENKVSSVFFDMENSGVVRAFLDAHPEFKLDPFENPLTGKIAPGMLRIDGGIYDCDTLFGARMIKVQ